MIGQSSTERAADSLVGIGFRCALMCVRSHDLATADRGLCLLRKTVAARRLPERIVSDFTAWGLAIEVGAERPIEILPVDCIGFCADERLAIALVAACQHGACPALAACAAALLGSADVACAMAATQSVATALRSGSVVLTPPGVPGGVRTGGTVRGAPSWRLH